MWSLVAVSDDSSNKLVVDVMSDDRSDGCRVGFAPREHGVGTRGPLVGWVGSQAV